MSYTHRLILTTGLFLAFAATGAQAGSDKVTIPPAPPEAPASGWKFMLEPYGWATALDGTEGIGGLTIDVDVPFKNVLKHLDWALFLQGEARNGRWGILANGFYAELSDVGDPSGPLYDSVNAVMGQGLVELALAYRMMEGRRGFVDIFIGGRYNYLSLEISANIDSGGVQQLSDNASRRIVGSLVSRAEQIAVADILALRARIEAGIAGDLDRRLTALGDKVADSTRGRRPLLERDGAIRRDVAAAVRAVAEQRAAVLRGASGKDLERANAAVQSSEKKLARTINNKVRDALPEHVSGDKQWVDPFIGIRAQYNFNDRFFATARGDIGGFGVSSLVTYQLNGSVGYNFNKSVFTEIGYRYLYTDYKDGGFTYDVAQSGLYLGLGIKF